MICQWETASKELKDFVGDLLNETNAIIDEQVIGWYLHGSLALGGFNPDKSDIDLIIVTAQPVSIEEKRKLANFFLQKSKRPYPVEISILNVSQLAYWQYPTPYDFHWSEYWRERYDRELRAETALYLNREEKTDVDLAAHLMILNERGICLTGKPIKQVFPTIPEEDYLASILEDYKECLESILQKPVYCVLNLLRVFWYVADGTIASKEEAGGWGAKELPVEYQPVILQALFGYGTANTVPAFNEQDLLKLRGYVDKKVEKLLKERSCVS